MARRTRDHRDRQLADAVTAARARELTADKTGRRRDRLRFTWALGKVAWRMRQTERRRGR